MTAIFHRPLPDFANYDQTKDQRFAPMLVAESSLVDLILIECHREVKAANLILEPHTREPTSKHWLDFGGIAWAHRSTSSSSTAEAAAIATAENRRHNERLEEGQRLGHWTGKPRPVGRSEEG